MSRLMHRTCDTALAETERALREAQDRAYRLGERIVIETQHAGKRRELLDRASMAVVDQRLEHHAERERLRAELAAARQEIERLRSRDGVLEQRRRRAAETALEPAWHGPDRDSAGNRAQVAQALLALPLASYDVALAYQLDGNDVWYWTIDGRAVDTGRWDYGRMDQEQVLTGRYGFTDSELSQIRREAEDTHRHVQALASEEF